MIELNNFWLAEPGLVDVGFTRDLCEIKAISSIVLINTNGGDGNRYLRGLTFVAITQRNSKPASRQT